MPPKIRSLLLDDITVDPRIQSRAGVNQAHVDELAAVLTVLKESNRLEEMKPVICYNDGIESWLSEGFHRELAHRQADIPYINVELRVGTFQDALENSIHSNREPALVRSNADKRTQIGKALDLEKYRQASSRFIAQQLLVSAPLVEAVRAERRAKGEAPVAGTVTARRGDQEYEIKRPAPKPEKQQEEKLSQPAPKPEPAAAEPDEELTTADAGAFVNSLPLYQAFQQFGHKGTNFKKQALEWQHNRKAIVNLREQLPNSASGPFTDIILALYAVPAPSEWQACGTCYGSHYVQGEPCHHCKEGYVLSGGVPASEVQHAAP